MRVVTVLGIHQLARAAALAGSVLRADPDARITAVLLGEANGSERIGGVDLLGFEELGLGSLDMLASQFDDISLNRVVAGPALVRALEEDEKALFIDSSLTVTGPIEHIVSKLATNPVIVGRRCGERELHPGFVALARGDAADRLLAEWPTSSVAGLVEELPEGRPLDAFTVWFQEIPEIIPQALVLPDLVAGIADEEETDPSPGPPLLFDWDDLDSHAVHQVLRDGIGPTAEIDMVALLRDYQVDIERAEPREPGRNPWGELPDGTRVDRRLGQLAGVAIAEGAVTDPIFTENGMRQLYGWLAGPSSLGKAADAAGLNRYHEALWATRPDLQDAYPEVDGEDAEGFAGWLNVYGPERVPFPEELVPPLPAFLAGDDGAKLEGQEGTTDLGDARWGVNVAGFFTSELGQGEAARLLIAALDAADVPCVPIQGELLPPSRQQADFNYASPTAAPYAINIVCINGDGIPIFADEVGESFMRDRYTIALWWWETDRIPDEWEPAFELIDEVWVASDLIREAVEPVSPVPVTKIPLPVSIPPRDLPDRTGLGLPEGFVFMFVFDYHSTVARKNPEGVIRAFRKAFQPGSGASLVIKTINAENRPWEQASVLNAAGDHPDIHFIDGYVSAAEKDGLIASCDCYVSLHRSEGFGLTPAEAMWFARPIIATGYGGVTEFMTPENSYLVLGRKAYVGENAPPYPPEGEWVEPDIDEAAALMREVFENRDRAREKGLAGARDIRLTHSPKAAGAAMEKRLEAIFKSLPEGRGEMIEELPELDRRALPERLAEEQGAQGNPFLRPLRAIARKLMGPDLQRQAGTNRELLGVIDNLDRQVRDVAVEIERNQVAGQAESMATFRRLEAATGEIRVQLAEVLQLLAEHRSLPAMELGPEFTEWTDPVAGNVSGYQGGTGSDRGAAGFADAFRGSEEHVRELQRPYVDLLKGHGPVLDIGCGRGEMLDLLREAGIEASGIDLDSAMVEVASGKGHNVSQADAIGALESVEDAVLGTIFSAQLIEHLPVATLERLLNIARERLRPDGLFVAETVNPHCVNALKTFWVDPSHEHPLFPETMLQLARAAGFESAYIFHPGGSGDIEADRYRAPAYALVARVAG